MSEIQRISVLHQNYEYQEVLRIFADSSTYQEPPTENGYSVGLVLAGMSKDQRISQLLDQVTENERTVNRGRGRLNCIFTGAMLYPILRIAEMGKLVSRDYMTIYVLEELGIQVEDRNPVFSNDEE